MHLLYQVAHHDIWWAKTQLWTSTSWALALLSAIVGIGVLAYGSEGLVLRHTWRLVALAVLVSWGAGAYLARLHYDMVRARYVALALRERRPKLEKLIQQLPMPGKNGSEGARGMWFSIALTTIIAVGLGIATHLLARDCKVLAFAAGFVQLLVGCSSLAVAANSLPPAPRPGC